MTSRCHLFTILFLSLFSASVLTAELPHAGRQSAVQPPATDALPPHASFESASAALKETRHINVYTPPDYANGTANYPVLYMPDGGLDEDFPHVAAAVDRAIRDGRMRALILVGIANTERRRDMTGPTEVAEDRKIAPRVGGSAAFRRFLRDELLPEIASRYRVTDERAIVGESLAGLFVLETCTQEPDLFGTCVALSPSLWWNRGALLHALRAQLKARSGWRARWYVATAGDDQIGGEADALRAILIAGAPASMRWQIDARPDLRHDNIYRTLAPEVLPRLFQP
ncbi:MAG: alpha/beta hydrolase [Rhodanobacteraceae bacterium]|nr:alpha/beta hydrolase [Rhodanobacteraceae bacterium]